MKQRLLFLLFLFACQMPLKAGASGTDSDASHSYALLTSTIVVSRTTILADQTANVTITFNGPVTGFSLACLHVTNGTLSAISTSDNITYTVIFTPFEGILDSSNVITLIYSSITDSEGHTGTGTNTSGNFSINTLGPKPLIATVDVPLNGTYTIGGQLLFIVNYDAPVVVNVTNGTPYLNLVLASGVVKVPYVSGSGTSSLMFKYTVQQGDLDANGPSLGTNLQPNGGIISNATGAEAEPLLQNVGSLAGVFINGIPPNQPDVNGVLYVKKGSTGNGESWAKALGEVTDALNTARNNTAVKEIWVAAGTYQPDAGNYFSMVEGVKMYGGFAGSEANRSDRNWVTNVATLKGNGNSVIYNDFNGLHPMTPASVLDGFTITGGNSNFDGGGMHNNYASPIIANVRIQGNISSGAGGGIFNNYSSSLILNSILSGNTAKKGGGIYNNNGSYGSVINSTLYGNIATLEDGGAIYSFGGWLNLVNTLIWDNGSGLGGGNYAPVQNCLIEGRNEVVNGNINADGLTTSQIFTDALNGDYSLKMESPAVNKGNNSLYPDLTAASVDLTGKPRVFGFATGNVIDIGAYEYQGNVRQPPVLTTSSGHTVFVAGDNVTSTPVVIDPGIDVGSQATTTLSSATIAITTGFKAGQDILVFTSNAVASGDITGSYNSSTGILTLVSSGAATLQQWKAALSGITYTNSAVTPETNDRVVNFTVNDGIKDSNTATKTITVMATDQTPIITASGGNTVYTLGQAVVVDAGIMVFDLDNITLASASVNIGNGFQSGQDILIFINSGNIAGSYDVSTGVLTLTSSGATATLAQWQSTLSSVSYFNRAADQRTGDRTIVFTINDGTKSSASTSKVLVQKALLSQTITAGAVSKVYGASDFEPGATASSSLQVSYVSNDKNIADAYLDPADSKWKIKIKKAGSVSITVSQPGNGTYSPAPDVSMSLTISPAPLTITATNESKIYDKVAYRGGNGVTFNGFVLGETQAVLSGSLVYSGTSDGAINTGTYTLIPSGLTSPNYNITFAEGTLKILKAVLVLTADAKTKLYGDTDPVFTYSITGLIGNDLVQGSLNRMPGEGIGIYAIQQGNLKASDNYTIVYSGANLTIGKKTIAVVADAKSKVYGESDPVLTYTFSPALIAADRFTGSLKRASGENAGMYVIDRSDLALSANYDLTYTSADLTIKKKAVSVVAEAKSKIYGDTDPLLSYTSMGLVNGDLIQGALSRMPGEGAGSYAILQGTLSASGNYELSYIGANLTIGKKTIAVVADAKSKVYGDTDPALTYTFSPALSGTDQISGALSRVSGENVNTYLINQNTLTAGPNYSLNYQNAPLTITKAVLTVTAENQMMCQGNILPAFNVTYSGFKNGDGESAIASKPAVNTLAKRSSPAGNYVLTPTGGTASNYTFTYVNGDLKINSLPIVSITSDKGSNVSKGETLVLTAKGGTTYEWSGSNIISSRNGAVLTIRPTQNETYTVTATNSSGCSQSQTYSITIRDDFQAVSASNILSPNGDGVNDLWVVKNIDMYPNNEVKIFDKAGRLIYSKRGYDNTWDGTFNGNALAENTYYYIIDFGTGKLKQKGYITLIRQQ